MNSSVQLTYGQRMILRTIREAGEEGITRGGIERLMHLQWVGGTLRTLQAAGLIDEHDGTFYLADGVGGDGEVEAQRTSPPELASSAVSPSSDRLFEPPTSGPYDHDREGL